MDLCQPPMYLDSLWSRIYLLYILPQSLAQQLNAQCTELYLKMSPKRKQLSVIIHCSRHTVEGHTN